MNFKRKKVSLVKTKVAIIKDIRDDIDYIKEATCMKEAYNYAKDFNELL